MTTHVPMARVPFAPLDMQHLASARNSHNGTIAHAFASSGKANSSVLKSVTSPTKRPFEASHFDEFDSENIDPNLFSSPLKKSKSDVSEKPFKSSLFSPLHTKSMPPPPIPCRLSTPAKANLSSQRATMTAPAGRSPKRKASGMNKARRISAPFSRIDPPFSFRDTSSLPFSLDAALKGTFSSRSPRDAGATIQESMPKNWFFDIYEDTPEEEAATLMEHSTLTLDLSSDEESSKKTKEDRGKENTPPDGYDAPTASRPAADPTIAIPQHVKKTDIIRKKVFIDEMDDGRRIPLSDLETASFISEGLDKDSHVIVNPTPDKSSSSTKLDLNNLFAAPVPFTGSNKKSSTRTSSTSLFDLPIVNAEGDVKGDIIVWEDSPTSSKSSSPTPAVQVDDKIELHSAKGAFADENTHPIVNERV